MRRVLLGLVLTLAAVAVLHLVALGDVLAQAPTPLETSKSEVVLTKLSPVVFPPLARMANIVGDVRVQVGIRKDGTIASAELVSGHPMLKQAALESAQQSQFECRGCSEAVTPYLLTYTFEIKDDGSCCDAQSRVPEVTQRQAHINIVSAQICICDPAFTVTKKIRSAKCFYLWKCGLSDH
jgi:TonB family protein